MLVRIRKNWKPYTLLVRIQTDAGTLKNRQSLKRLNTHLSYDPAISSADWHFSPLIYIPISRYRCLSEKNEDSCSHKNLHTNVHSSITHNSQKGNNTNVQQLINKMWSFHIKELYSGTNAKFCCVLQSGWLDSTVLNEKRQPQRATQYDSMGGSLLLMGTDFSKLLKTFWSEIAMTNAWPYKCIKSQ